MSVTVGLTLLLFAIPIFGISNEWSQSGIWNLGVLAGVFLSMALVVTISKKKWLIIAPFIDWKRIEAITTSGEK